MDKIIIKADKPQEHARDVCNKIYNIRGGEFEIESGTEDRVVVVYKCPDISVDSKVYLTTDDGAFTG